jgi:YHS domain-containing protein
LTRPPTHLDNLPKNQRTTDRQTNKTLIESAANLEHGSDEKMIISAKPRKEKGMLRNTLVIAGLMTVGLSTAAIAGAARESQGAETRGMMQHGCCMQCMMQMGGMPGMDRMAGRDTEAGAQQPPTEGQKKAGEEFTCPLDGMRMKVAENTPAAEYEGKTYYFCSEAEKQTFLKNPERYVKEPSAK